MAGTKHSEDFDELVEWAYTTLPQQIRELPDFPGIQVVDEPPEHVSNRKKRFPPGKETLGLFSGVGRTERRHNDVRLSPDLIFVFRGPIQRCSRGDLRAEVKEVVWHEVAHWLGYNEQEVKELGLSTLTIPPERATLRPGERKPSSNTTLQRRLPGTSEEADEK